MQYCRARHAGACYGVKRALRMVEEALSSSSQPVFTLGPLIHNPAVVEGLARRGIKMVDSVDQIDTGTVVIRSHGVGPQVVKAARARGLEVLDATCPHVSKAQDAASDLSQAGYCVIVVGERGHPEVEGISAYAGANAMVVQTPAELAESHIQTPVGVLAQTTQTEEALAAIVSALNNQGYAAEVRDTICFATRQRQEAASELAAQVDVMLVVGGRNSSNTTRLAEICAAVCRRTHHLEDPAELSADWFSGDELVGITAGASTPEEQIVAVEMQLQAMFGAEVLEPGDGVDAAAAAASPKPEPAS